MFFKKIFDYFLNYKKSLLTKNISYGNSSEYLQASPFNCQNSKKNL